MPCPGRAARPDPPPSVPDFLDDWKRQPRYALPVLVHTGQITDHEDLGMPGEGEIGLHAHPTELVSWRVQALHQGRRLHAGRPEHGTSGDPRELRSRVFGTFQGDPRRIDILYARSRTHLYTPIQQHGSSLVGETLGEGRQHPIRSIDHYDPRRSRVEVPEVAGQGALRDLAQRTCQLDTRRTRTHDHEGELRVALVGIRLPLGGFEREQDAAAQLEGVFDILEAGCVTPPLVMAEVVVRGARGHDQIVVVQLSLDENDTPAVRFDASGFGQEDRRIPLPPEDAPDGRRNLRRREARRGHLVEQGLEQVVVAAIDDGEAHGRPAQSLGGVEPRESRPHDHHPGIATGHIAHQPSAPRWQRSAHRRRQRGIEAHEIKYICRFRDEVNRWSPALLGPCP